MSIFSRYLMRETLPLFVAALVALVLLLMLVALLGVLADVLARGVSPALVARYMLFKLPSAIGPGLPLALLFATLLALTRLGQDGEIKAALGRLIGCMVGYCQTHRPGVSRYPG